MQYEKIHISPQLDVCVTCGSIVPEGRQICPICEQELKRNTRKKTIRKHKVSFRPQKNAKS